MAINPWITAATNPLVAALQGAGPGGGNPLFGAPARPFENAELDLINQQADEAQAAGSPVNDWSRYLKNKQAQADLYGGYHGGRSRGEVTQGVGVPAIPTPKVGVGTTLYRADPGTRQFTFRGGDPTGNPTDYLSGQIAAAQGAGGTPENSPQLYNLIGQQSAQQEASSKQAMAQAEQLKGQAHMAQAAAEQGKTDYVTSGEAHRRAMKQLALEKGLMGPMALETEGIPQAGAALAADLGLHEGDLGKAIAQARARGITSAPPESAYGKAIAHLYGPQIQYLAQGQNPYKWGNPDPEQTRAFLGIPAPGTALPPSSIAAPGMPSATPNPGVLRNTTPYGDLPPVSRGLIFRGEMPAAVKAMGREPGQRREFGRPDLQTAPSPPAGPLPGVKPGLLFGWMKPGVRKSQKDREAERQRIIQNQISALSGGY